MAGFTTERDLGTEGAGFADVGLKQAINQGIVPGPRLLVATKANVARGAYGPKGYEPGLAIPQGAEEVSGPDEMTKAARDQIAAGADVIKMYADYHYAPQRAEPPDPDRSRNGGRRRRWLTMRAASPPPTPPPPKACAARSSPASTRSSTAMAAPPKCSR